MSGHAHARDTRTHRRIPRQLQIVISWADLGRTVDCSGTRESDTYVDCATAVIIVPAGDGRVVALPGVRCILSQSTKVDSIYSVL